MFRIGIFLFSLMTLSLTGYCKSEDSSPTLLKKSTKKEKFREEVLVTKEVNINDLYLKKFLNLELVNKIFPSATNFKKIDKETLSSAIYRNDELLGYIFETFDVTRGLGYSRRPFHIAVGIDLKGFIKSVELLKHVEPIAILGRTDDDFIKYLNQYKNIDLTSGISLTLNLTGAAIKGDNVAMRETAGDTASLTQIDGVSRTTTSSLLFMDAMMRGARKLARQKNIILASNDLGNFIDLETYQPMSWQQLLIEKSLITKKISMSNLNEVFNKFAIEIPRKLKYKNENDIFANIYFANVSPAGVGVNILGRRWFDQYISAGRNVDDQVYYIAIEGENWLEYEGRIANVINKKKFFIKQNEKKILLSSELFKELPFNHAKKAPNIIGQGLFYLSSEYGLNPQQDFQIIYELENDKGKTIDLNFTYKLPNKYNTKSFLIENNNNDNYLKYWKKNIIIVTLTFFTLITACSFFLFTEFFTKQTKHFKNIRTLFLIWILVWLGWFVGGQLSVIHLINFFTMPITQIISFDTFLIEPVIFIIGSGTLVTLVIWGRGVFCGWLCPFGALQELLAIIRKKLRIKKFNISPNIESKIRYVKYILLFLILIFTILESNIVNYLYNIEPFKTAITLRFIAPKNALFWTVIVLLICFYIERAYCRYICPLGGGLALIGKIRIYDYLKRRKECGNPCKACSTVCPTGAIMDSGKINMHECLGCLDCQVMLSDFSKCPPLVASKKN